MRFLRIDEGLRILEKDADTGYVLFELSDEGKRFTGSVELVRHDDNGKAQSVELIVRIADRPSYMELGILDRMLLKIRDELGQPRREPPPKPKKEKAPKPKPKEEAEEEAPKP